MLTAVPSHGGSLENGKQDVKDPENAREGSLVSQPVTRQAGIVRTPCLPSHDQFKEDLNVQNSHASHQGPLASFIICPEPQAGPL